MSDHPHPPTQSASVLKNVRIRMYRPGLGDCFLLTFTNQDQQKYNLLIDCGVLPISGGDQRLGQIIQGILDECDGHLQAVSVTHEHADHISGFTQENFFWAKEHRPAVVDQVWLPWTENPKDRQVEAIIKKVEALSLASAGVALAVDDETSQRIQDLLLFQGIEIIEEDAQAADSEGKKKKTFKISQNLADKMNYVRGLVSEPRYLEQKDVIELTDFGVRIYCLGPSRDIPMLGGSAQASGETALAASPSPAKAFLARAVQYAYQRLGSDVESPDAASAADAAKSLHPFYTNKCLDLETVKACCQSKDPSQFAEDIQEAAKFFGRVYGFGEKKSARSPSWRRIDEDWLRAGEGFALQQVSIVNNTSLVLAIELLDTHQVLLFVGDAEEENWQTWKNDHAEVKKLLGRTVVYKVGHHGSINATDKTVLENSMAHKDLVALIPTDIYRANIKHWEFPDPGLYAPAETNEQKKGLLYNQTHGRILLNCVDECRDCEHGPLYDETKTWPGEVKVDPESEKLWVDYILNISPPG